MDSGAGFPCEFPTLHTGNRLTSTVSNCKLYADYDTFHAVLDCAAREALLMDEKPDDVLTIEELADYLKIPKSTLYKLVREGKVPS